MNPYTIYTDFTESRTKGVGSSDIPVLAGLTSQYESTPVTLFEEKKGITEGFQGNEKTDWGHLLEPLIVERFLGKHFGDVRPNLLKIGMSEFFHPEYKYALAHPDMIIVEPDREPFIIEAKSMGHYSGKRDDDPDKGYDEDDFTERGIPAGEYLQIQWQMLCSGINQAFVAALIDTNDFRMYGPIMANPRVQEKCLALARRFWDCMENNICPAPSTFKDIQILFPKPESKTKVISGEALDSVHMMQSQKEDIKKKIKALENKEDDIKKAIGQLCEGNEVLSDPEGNVLATYKMSGKRSISVKEVEKNKEIFDLLTENELIKNTEFPKLSIKKNKSEE